MRSPAQHLSLIGVIAAVALAAFACSPAPAPKKDKANAADPNAEQNPGDEQNDDGTAKKIETGDDSLSNFVDTATVAPGVLTRRCATRLSIALTGKSPTAALSAMKETKPAVDQLVDSNDFAERYARFINAQFNNAPGMTGSQDPVYWLAKHVITTNRPWSDLFVGKFEVSGTGDTMTVRDDADGIGYFTSDAWMKTYSGNEEKGLMIAAAYRIFTNTTGLVLAGTVGKPGEDRTARGRQQTVCRGCHIDKWHALDGAANLLPRRNGMGDTQTFTAAPAGEQNVLNTKIGSERALIEALVASDDWRAEQCRNVFRFIVGRAENQCEAAVFDKCTAALSQQKNIRAAVKVVANDPAACK